MSIIKKWEIILKLLKWIGGVVIALLVLIVLAVIILPNVVDPNDYRDKISTLVKDNTGRDLKLDGNLELSVFPWLGIKTEGLSLSQPEGIEGNMLSVDTAQLRLKLTPLLGGNVEIDTVILSKPQVSLITLKNGLDSFSGLSGDETTTPDQEEAESESSSSGSVSLAIQGVEITDGLVVIDDRKAGSRMELSNLSLVTGNLLGGSLASVKATGQLKDSASPDITKFDLNAQASIDPNNFNVQLADLVAEIIQGEQNIELNLGSMSFTDSAAISAKDIAVTIAGPFNVNANIPSVSANLDTQLASMQTLTVDVENMKAQLNNVEVKSFMDDPSLKASLLVEKFDAAKLLKTMEIDFEGADATAMTSVGLSADMSGGMNGASISNLDVTLDQTKLTGKAAIRDFEKPKITFDLNLNEINLDRYLPETTEEAEEETSGDALAVPMELFSDIDANGSFRAQKFTSGGVSLTDIDVLIESTPGNVSITPKAKLYDGELDGVIAYNKVGDTSTLKVNNNIGIVQLGKLLLDADVTDRFEGIGKLAVDLLITDVNGKQTNEGVFTLSANNGQIKGVNINKIIDQASSAFSALKKDDNQDPEQTAVESEPSDLTEFADLSGTFNMNNFLVTNNDLKMVAPGFNITGKGKMNLELNTIDYSVSVAISEKVSSSLAGMSIPVRCKGALDAPSCLPDMAAMYKLYLKSKLNDKKSALKDKLFGGGEEEVTDGAPETKKQKRDKRKKKLLKGLFD
jgi:AsmA protein